MDTPESRKEAAARESAERYFRLHPETPSATRRPQIFARSGTWVALLGPSVEHGIVGLGLTVEAALHAFDGRYRAAQRTRNAGPPKPRRNIRRTASMVIL